MQETKLSFLSDACGGKLTGMDQTIKDVKIDSRRCGEGDMFVCVVGENNNGHKYIKSAYESGCRAFLVSEPVEEMSDAGYVHVENTESAFAKMADGYLSQFDIRRVAATGSVGKTTAKEMISSVPFSDFSNISFNSFSLKPCPLMFFST